MKVGKYQLVFWITWIVLLGILKVFTVLHKSPQSMHQWAQCDRASVALNYAEESMNFFKPRVHECKNFTGITGLEFPIMNYAAAICYKVFGFNEFWYRLLMLVVVSLGVFYGVKMAGYFIPSYFYALLVPLIWFLSPILVFYTPNFIPDAAGLGFCLIGWWAFFAYQKAPKTKYLVLFKVLMSLASLVKIAYLMLVGVVIGLLVLDYLKFFNWKEKKQYFKSKGKFFVALVVIVVLTVSWYKYSAWLSYKYSASYFLLDVRPETNLSDFFDLMFNTFHFWANSFYYGGILFFVVLGLLFISYFYKKINRVLLATTVLYFLGNACFYFIMAKQFQHHDYYYISTYLFVFFLFLTIMDVVYKVTRENLIYLRMGLPLILLFMLFGGIANCLSRYDVRYDGDGKMNYSVFYPAEFDGVKEYVRSLGLSRDNSVVVAFDPSPNIALYFMDLKGYSFSSAHPESVIVQRFSDYKPEYLICNNDKFFSQNTKLYDVVDFEQIGKKNDFKVFKLNYHE